MKINFKQIDAFRAVISASFSKMHPEAMVKFEIGQDDATVEWMVSQSFDFGVSISKPTNPTIDYKLVDETPMFCVVPKSHHLAQRKVIRPRDLAGETFTTETKCKNIFHKLQNKK